MDSRRQSTPADIRRCTVFQRPSISILGIEEILAASKNEATAGHSLSVPAPPRRQQRRLDKIIRRRTIHRGNQGDGKAHRHLREGRSSHHRPQLASRWSSRLLRRSSAERMDSPTRPMEERHLPRLLPSDGEKCHQNHAKNDASGVGPVSHQRWGLGRWRRK